MIDSGDCDPRLVAQAACRATGEAAGDAHLIAQALYTLYHPEGWTDARIAAYQTARQAEVAADFAHLHAEDALLRLLKRKGLR